MKKLLALAVVFGLVVGGAFAADMSGEVIGTVNVMQGTSADGDDDITTSAEFTRIRLETSGGNDNFGAWIRADGFVTGDAKSLYSGKGHQDSQVHFFDVYGLAWWKPIDQFKLTIGGNPDGIFGKEGNSAWMFYQRVSDTDRGNGGVVNAGNAWGRQYGPAGVVSRSAFFGGWDINGMYLEIKPVDMIGINIMLPVFGLTNGGPEGWWPVDNKMEAVFGNLAAQLDLNLDFGNIALTFKNATVVKDSYGGMYDSDNDGEDDTPWFWSKDDVKNRSLSNLYLYFGLTAVENLTLDFGLGLQFTQADLGDGALPIAIGLAAKYDVSDQFGLKLRTAMSLGGKDAAGDPTPFEVFVDILPYFAINDNVKVFCSLGLSAHAPDGEDADTGFHLNPYIWVGEEWGPSFWAGLRIFNGGGLKDVGADLDSKGKAKIHWEVPIAIGVAF